LKLNNSLICLLGFMTLKNIDRDSFVQSFLATILIFSFLLISTQAYAAAVTLSVNVQTSLTFTTTNQGLATTATNITPGTPIMGTTSLNVTTNDAIGWNVTLAGDNKNAANNNLQLVGATSSQITDQAEWINGAATTSAGTAVRISALGNTGNVLAYRVMTASSTNGGAFTATSWWGTADSYAADNANTLYAGISSSTALRTIGNAGSGSYSASQHVNDVQYYLNVAPSQKTGAYTAPITYTATGN
jgi:hypothetical protein